MAKQSITVELDDETIRYLAVLGNPIEVVARLAYSAADGVRRPGHKRRTQTNQSLQIERDNTDIAIAKDRDIVEEEADESEYWLELGENLSSANHDELARLKSEASQLVAIMVQSKKTARTAGS